jgi:hypothetical protein
MLNQSTSSHAVVANAGVRGKQQNCVSFFGPALCPPNVAAVLGSKPCSKLFILLASFEQNRFSFPQLRDGVRAISGWGVNVRVGCAPCKGGAFQWVQAPPGNRSSRKQSEQPCR